MHLDVQDLRNFYYRSTLGRAAQKVVRGQVLKLWPEAAHQTVVGFGFAAPLLRPYLADARRVTAPLEWFPRLLRATPAQRANWRLIGSGVGIHWDDVDEDISLRSLGRAGSRGRAPG